MTSQTACPVCSGTSLDALVSIPRAPVFCNQLCRSRGTALSAAMASIDLRACQTCGHVFNAAFDPSLVEYGPEYENSLHFSGRFQHYARELADELVERYGLAGQTVVEVGCGQGDFLDLLCERGAGRCFGFDPSAQERDEAHEGGQVTIARASYSSSMAGSLAPRLLCCRQVLEHIASPVALLRDLRQACGRPEGTAVFFEVPNALYTLRDGGIWDLIYEHCSYFTAPSLRRTFVEAGFVVDEVQEAFEGQFLAIHARAFEPSAAAPAPPDDESVLAGLGEVRRLASAFGDVYRTKVARWAEELESHHQHGSNIAVWGAGSKGNTFLNTVPGTDAIDCVVDINPRKHGMFVAGAGHPIVPPSHLVHHPPGLVVVMNPVYRDEISRDLASLGLSPEVICA